MKKLKLIIAMLTIAPMLTFATASAQNPLNPACQTNEKTRNSAICKQAAGQGTEDPIAGPNGLISKAANLIALIASIAAVVMIIIGGFFYITSAGNTEKAKKARDRIVAAAVGLVIIGLSWAIVQFISVYILG